MARSRGRENDKGRKVHLEDQMEGGKKNKYMLKHTLKCMSGGREQE